MPWGKFEPDKRHGQKVRASGWMLRHTWRLYPTISSVLLVCVTTKGGTDWWRETQMPTGTSPSLVYKIGGYSPLRLEAKFSDIRSQLPFLFEICIFTSVYSPINYLFFFWTCQCQKVYPASLQLWFALLSADESLVDGGLDPTFPPYYRGSSTTLADDDFYKNECSKPNKYHWVDRLLGIVCAKVSHEKKAFTSSRCAQNGSVVWHVWTQLRSAAGLRFDRMMMAPRLGLCLFMFSQLDGTNIIIYYQWKRNAPSIQGTCKATSFHKSLLKMC